MHLRAISQEILKISILDLGLKMNNLRLQPHLPWANELMIRNDRYMQMYIFILPQTTHADRLIMEFSITNGLTFEGDDILVANICLSIWFTDVLKNVLSKTQIWRRCVSSFYSPGIRSCWKVSLWECCYEELTCSKIIFGKVTYSLYVFAWIQYLTLKTWVCG